MNFDSIWSSGDGLVSNSPQASGPSLVIVKMKSPALLENSPQKNAIALVDANRLKQIEQEQTEFLEQIKNISAEIKVYHRYKFVLNAVALEIPEKFVDAVEKIGSVETLQRSSKFRRPTLSAADEEDGIKHDLVNNSVKFIGASQAHEATFTADDGSPQSIDGKGVRIGIIDSGIDYTHAMFGGAGTEAAYKAISPGRHFDGFPTAKVVGGYDFVGTSFNPMSADPDKHVPRPDDNPIDEDGHGTHVAGTVAGRGDNQNTYTGVAPGALLYAIKVFGAEGGTDEAVIIAALEYSANPANNGNPADRLDAVSMSLGVPYGVDHTMYDEAIQNLVRGGTVVVAAAGNEGPFDHIVDAPGTSSASISVAASIDNAEHNWHFDAVEFRLESGAKIIASVGESLFAKGLKDAKDVLGPLGYIGLGGLELTDEQQSAVRGKIALIDRGGGIPFYDKARGAAEAGAIAAVIVNSEPGETFFMGAGAGQTLSIPVVLIEKTVGTRLKEALKTAPVEMRFKSTEKFPKPQLIDTIARFSSKGPRSKDGFIKPEITAPGVGIVSAQMGGGGAGVAKFGTSMAVPHIVGVVGLLRQRHPTWSADEIKSAMMATAKKLKDPQGGEYPVSLQGAGRVQVMEALDAKVLSFPQGLSLGEQNVGAQKVVKTRLTLVNKGLDPVSLSFDFQPRRSGIQLVSSPTLQLTAGKSGTVSLSFALDTRREQDAILELDGNLKVIDNNTAVAQIPVLAVAKRISAVKAESLVVHSSAADSALASVELKLANNGLFVGDAMVFNLLGESIRKKNPKQDPFLQSNCDLQSVGYRIVHRSVEGQPIAFFQMAVKLYEAVTTWNSCEISVLIDTDGDKIADQELGGIAAVNLKGLVGDPRSFVSVLIDAAKAQDIRKNFEMLSESEDVKEDYRDAVVALESMAALGHSSVAIIETPVSALVRTDTGVIAIQISTLSMDQSPTESVDQLDWLKISLQEESQAYFGMPEKTVVSQGDPTVVDLTKGYGQQPMMILYPQNANVFSDLQTDEQAEILKPHFQF